MSTNPITALQWSQFKNQVSDRGEDKDGLALTCESSVNANTFIVHAHFNFTFLSAKLGMVVAHESIVLLDTD